MEIIHLNITKNKLLIIVLIGIVVLFLYLNSGALIDSIIKEKMNLNDWLSRNSFVWIPALLTFGLGFLTGWLLFRKRV
jgi:hypothetical protein